MAAERGSSSASSGPAPPPPSSPSDVREDVGASNGSAAGTTTASGTKRSNGPRAKAATSRADAEGEEAPTPSDASKEGGGGASRLLRVAGRPCLLALRCALVSLDLLLLLSFALLVLSASLRRVYDSHLSVQITNARFDDARAEGEATYYHRKCEPIDVTTTDPADLFLETSCADFLGDDSLEYLDGDVRSSARDFGRCASDHHQIHGASVFPSLLSPRTAQELRTYVLERNARLADDEAITVIENDRRWSFGVSPSDHPSVSSALKELSAHPLLVSALEAIAGPDPAVIELTAITSAYGAKDQRWHQDTVASTGNDLVYARSFVPSHSLFVPLQDTHAEMGATSVCPGTHVCYGGAVEAVCPALDVRAGSSRRAEEDGRPWKIGEGALVNQGLHHRGTAHEDPKGEERVLFIVTFAPRPKYDNAWGERRTIGLGGSYSMRWDVWGRTLYDFRDADEMMGRPRAPLRAMGMRKPRGAKWGWDHVSVMSGRIANDDQAEALHELEAIVDELRANATDAQEEEGTWKRIQREALRKVAEDAANEEESWEAFLSRALESVNAWLTECHRKIACAYVAVLAVLSAISRFRNGRRAGEGARAVPLPSWKANVALHFLIAAAALGWIRVVDETSWAAGIAYERRRRSSGAPWVVGPLFDAKGARAEATKGRSAPRGPTREDVLLGRGYDGRPGEDLHASNDFLDRHPGNVAFRRVLAATSQMSIDLATSLAMDELRKEGRNVWIQSAPGEEWTEPSKGGMRSALVEEAWIARGGSTGYVLREVRAAISDARFGAVRSRGIAIRVLAIDQLRALTRAVVDGAARAGGEAPQSPPRATTAARGATEARSRGGGPERPSPHFLLRRSPSTFRETWDSRDASSARESGGVFAEGDVVEANYPASDEWYVAAVTDVYRGPVDSHGRRPVSYDVEYLDGDVGEDFPSSAVREYLPPRLGEVFHCEAGEDAIFWTPCFVVDPEGDSEGTYGAWLVEEETAMRFLPTEMRRRTHELEPGDDVVVERGEDGMPTRGTIARRRGDDRYEVYFPEEDEVDVVHGRSARMYRAEVFEEESSDD